MKKDALFRGCTRPPMILGVPYIPFLIGAGGPLLLAMYFHLALLLLIPFTIFVMRMMAKKDEMIFRLLGLNLVFRFLPRNHELYGKAWVFTPHKYRKDAVRMRGYDQ
ncbi:VirB3 family type IV secretion system protein [Hydrogenophaga sp. 5NK40-0174]|uniref:type IV secretion system protein VirB3 n=1 Tax=Hydrogenophaga sp. 5NK40-0174 TaxID=3127649 RepID=UPI003107791E